MMLNPRPATKLVVTIPEDLPLDDHEKSLLSKGLNYIPTAALSDECKARADCKNFFWRVCLKAHFHSEQESSVNGQNANRSDDFTQCNFESLQPPGKFADYFITKGWIEVSKYNFKQRLMKTNLTPQEKAALTSLRQCSDIIIKPEDKGGAVMVLAQHLYIQEAKGQLLDNNYYQQQDRNSTMDNNNTISRVINGAFMKGELLESAVNLVVDNPHMSRFYLLPKIHKPGNPGRPIVSL